MDGFRACFKEGGILILKIEKGENFKAIHVRSVDRTDSIIHIQNTLNPSDEIQGYQGGLTCILLVELTADEHDYAQSIATSRGLSSSGIKIPSIRSLNTVEQILAKFKEAGLTLPEVTRLRPADKGRTKPWNPFFLPPS